MEQENAVDSFLYYLRKFLQIPLDGICQEQRNFTYSAKSEYKVLVQLKTVFHIVAFFNHQAQKL